MVWTGGGHFETQSFAFPKLAEGESLIRLTTATVCGSDRHTVRGRRPGACPSVLGHEGVGVVEDSRADLTPGQRVVFSVTSVCGQCRNCRRGLSAKCTSVVKVGLVPVVVKQHGLFETRQLVQQLSQTYPGPRTMEPGPMLPAVP